MDIKLKDFEGPLDLLLHLVSKYQMDIYDVPITEVIEQYLAYVSTLQAMKLEVTGEYMVMASQLMLIKSRKLLPKVVDQVDLEDDLEQDLLSQIEEYRKFKLLGQKMSLQHEDRALYYSKPKLELVYEDAELLHDKTAVDLFLAFSKVMTKKQEEFSKSHTTIVRDEYKIEDMMEVVRQRCRAGDEVLSPTRRLLHLRYPRASCPALEPPLSAGPRSGELRVNRRRLTRSNALHGVAPESSSERDAPRH